VLFFADESFDRTAGLRRQHREFLRTPYDGHRRHSGLTSNHRYGVRRSRRRWNYRMTVQARAWTVRLPSKGAWPPRPSAPTPVPSGPTRPPTFPLSVDAVATLVLAAAQLKAAPRLTAVAHGGF
jgi:hypothetical protein